ncbi:DNA translocase FtsK [Streptomyces albireticuli]|uniref:DNA translocase FtsK n=2 Tax=Streptomyces albireticuli TaxID=1940 RepID=UPI00118071B5|nr:DNA translocase FtsK [Streptomyces albireticuli]MCD9145894.1 DNA translocase FtsK [Streptomyces albireticuli]MCD9196344.1 DNA translocase FtsK [Streptomyces albireticuli]
MASAVTAAGLCVDADVAALPPNSPLELALAVAVGGGILDARKGLSRSAMTVRAASWLAGGTWCSWALVGLNGGSVAFGASLAAFLGLINRAMLRTEDGRKERRAKLLMQRDIYAKTTEWEERLERITGIKGVHCPDMEPWPRDAGYTLPVELPGGALVQHVAQHKDAFASDLRLPPGCGVEVAQGAHRGQALIRVTTRDILADLIPYPEDYSELTITEPFPIGLHPDGTETLASLLSECGILIGETDSGKTNQLHTFNANLSRMPDALIWHIDITGAGISLPWITPWAVEESAVAPIVDWTANTPDEARIMLRMAKQVITTRKARYQRLMRSRNTDVIPVSPEVPAIVVVADETAQLPHDIKDLLDDVIELGRAVRVRALTCGLRATQDTITAMMKKQSKLRIGMTVTDPEELAYLFPGFKMLDPNDAPYSGSGFHMMGKESPIRTFKGWRLTPNEITAICNAVADRRPVIDRISASVPAGRYYGQRWARTLRGLYPEEIHLGELSEDAAALLDDTAMSATEIVQSDAFADMDDADASASTTTTKAVASASGSAADAFAAADATLAAAKTPVPAAPPVPASPAAQAQPSAAVGTTGRPRLYVIDGGASHPAREEDDYLLAPPSASAPAAPAGAGDGFEEVIRATGEPSRPPVVPGTPQAPAPLPRAPKDRALELLRDAGRAGLEPKRLHERLSKEGYEVAVRTVRDWCKSWADKGEAERDDSGQYTKYRVPAEPVL